jgi:hypothetical protein
LETKVDTASPSALSAVPPSTRVTSAAGISRGSIETSKNATPTRTSSTTLAIPETIARDRPGAEMDPAGHALTRTRARHVIPNLLALRTADPKLEAATRVVWERRRDAMVEVLRRGVQRGELPPDADFGLLADLLHGPLYYRLLISGAPIGRGLAEEIADAVLPLRRPACA